MKRIALVFLLSIAPFLALAKTQYVYSEDDIRELELGKIKAMQITAKYEECIKTKATCPSDRLVAYKELDEGIEASYLYFVYLKSTNAPKALINRAGEEHINLLMISGKLASSKYEYFLR